MHKFSGVNVTLGVNGVSGERISTMTCTASRVWLHFISGILVEIVLVSGVVVEVEDAQADIVCGVGEIVRLNNKESKAGVDVWNS